MHFDPALAARAALQQAEAELGPDWPTALELEEVFSSSAGPDATDAYEALLQLAERHPRADAFQAFCIYITWQQVTEHTIARHFETGVRLSERYLLFPEDKKETDLAHIQELRNSFKAGLGMDQEDELQREFGKDVPKGGD
jgi:hypothetical protein